MGVYEGFLKEKECNLKDPEGIGGRFWRFWGIKSKVSGVLGDKKDGVLNDSH